MTLRAFSYLHYSRCGFKSKLIKNFQHFSHFILCNISKTFSLGRGQVTNVKSINANVKC